MNLEQSRKLVKATFEQEFDKSRFTIFIKNLIPDLENVPFSQSGIAVKHAFGDYISHFERIGKIRDDDKELDVLIVYLKHESHLDRARTMQRNFIAYYLNGSRGGKLKDAALVAFVSPSKVSWRFSFVEMQYKTKLDEHNNKVKIYEEYTHAKRMSFLVGKGEGSHTAQSQLATMLFNTKTSYLSVKEAFNIEVVTDEFYIKYRELFIRLKSELENIIKKYKIIESEFQVKKIDIVDFTKKLLGQIVFLYFLQKRGWFGIAKGSKWGEGSKRFIRELFNQQHCSYSNFFNDVMEPLFYEALRINRKQDDDYYSRFNCRIPFLNGGLFDPINSYDWVNTDVLIPNDLFSNNRITTEGDIGDGILDVFDRYNFTVNEDEPLEKEVAIDPEMLGKVFENLLEVKDRKAKGSYYTPRDIVHYMCQKSLVDYLHQNLGDTVSRDDLSDLVFNGHLYKEFEVYYDKLENKQDLQKKSIKNRIGQHAVNIDELLDNVLVCDPAVGSGAFPVSMMSEIVKLRLLLREMKLVTETIPEEQRINLPYYLKKHCIQNSLYGVDIDSGAIEIAKLRMWLSLIVDEDDVIDALPNLDYKVVCGNSLTGIEITTLNYTLFSELEVIKEQYKKESDVHKKIDQKYMIDALLQKLSIGHYDFDFHVFFSEVFHDRDGFDIIIGNPPWEKVKPHDPEFFKLYDSDYRKYSKEKQNLLKSELRRDYSIEQAYDKYLNSRKSTLDYAKIHYKLQGSSDLNLFKMFIERSIGISKSIICWLVPGSVTIDDGSAGMRNYLLNENVLDELIGFTNRDKLFRSVDNNQKFVILSLVKGRCEKDINVYGWIPKTEDLPGLKKISLDIHFFKKLDKSNLTFLLDSSPKSYDLLDRFRSDERVKRMADLPFHYWREYDATMDAKYFNDIKGRHKLFSGKAINHFDCMAKGWIEKHGRSAIWKPMAFPKDEASHRTEYYVDSIPEKMQLHHDQDESNFRIVIQNVTGAVANIRTLYTCTLHKKHMTNNSLHNVFIGRNDKELFYYLGLLNSFVVDWQARLKVASNLNKFILESFLLVDYAKADEYTRNRISDLSFYLSNVCSDYQDLESTFNSCEGISRFEAEIELNDLAARLYSLSRSDFDFILSYFELVKNELKEELIKTYFDQYELKIRA